MNMASHGKRKHPPVDRKYYKQAKKAVDHFCRTINFSDSISQSVDNLKMNIGNEICGNTISCATDLEPEITLARTSPDALVTNSEHAISTNNDEPSFHKLLVTNVNIAKDDDLALTLAKWAVEHHISHRAINDLLAKILKPRFSFLPSDARTLLRTPRLVSIKPLSGAGGQYYHFGLRSCIEKLLYCSDYEVKNTSTINICIISMVYHCPKALVANYIPYYAICLIIEDMLT